MNPLIYERIIGLVGLAGIWFLWYYFLKPQRVDSFREELFALRERLFDLAADGVVSFDHPAYAQLRLLINGMIRFAHRITFPMMVVAATQGRYAPRSEYEDWQASVQKLPEESRKRLLTIHVGVFRATMRQVIGGSPALWIYLAARVAFSAVRALLLLAVGRRSVSGFMAEHVRLKVSLEGSHMTIAATKAIEARVLHDEQRRTGVEDKHAYAH